MWKKPPVWLAVRSVLRPVAQTQQPAQAKRQRGPANPSSSPRWFFVAAARLPASQNAGRTLSLRTCQDAVGNSSAPAMPGARGLHLVARPDGQPGPLQRINRRTAGFDAAVAGRRGVLQSASHHLVQLLLLILLW